MKIVMSTKQLANNPNMTAIADELSAPSIKAIGADPSRVNTLTTCESQIRVLVT